MENLSLVKAIALGAIQGATEFLPISSSGHLVIAQQWLALSNDGVFLMAFDIALHCGTLAAVLAVFYRDLIGVVRSFFTNDGESATYRWLFLFLILGTVPAAVIGTLFKDFFSLLFADPIPASFFLIITGGILYLTKWVQFAGVGFREMRFYQALLVGVAQAVAIIPGISRSGSTISMGLFLKMKPETAVRFSFLLSIPAIAGAAFLEAPQFAAIESSVLIPVLAGVLTSFVVGYIAIRWMLSLVRNHRLHFFSWYCWAFGTFVLVKEIVF